MEDVDTIAVDRITEPVYEFVKEFADANFSAQFLEEQGFQYALALQPSLPQYDVLAHHMRVAKSAVIAARARLEQEGREKQKQRREEIEARILVTYPDAAKALHPTQ